MALKDSSTDPARSNKWNWHVVALIMATQSSSNFPPNSPSRISSGAGPRLLRTKQGQQTESLMWLIVLTPFGLYTEENPHPTPHNFHQLHQEDAALQIVEVVQMRRKLEAPCAPQKKIYRNCRIVHFLRVKISVSPQAIGVLGVIPVPARREK